MATEKKLVAELTVDELKQLIREIVDERLNHFLKPDENLNWDEVRAMVRRYRATTPPVAMSGSQILFEERALRYLPPGSYELLRKIGLIDASEYDMPAEDRDTER